MKKLLVLLVVILAIVACTTPVDTVYSDGELHLPALQHYTLHIDPSVSDHGVIAGLVPAPLNLDGDKKYELTISMTGPAATEGATPEELKQYGLD